MGFFVSPYATFRKVFQVTSPVRRNRLHQTVSVPAMLETLEPRQMMTASSTLGSAPMMTSFPSNQLMEAAATPGSGNGFSLTAVQTTSGGTAMLNAALPSASSFSFTATATSSTTASLNWNRVTGATGYVIDIWWNNQWVELGRVPSTSTGVNITGLAAGTQYIFDVGAIKGSSIVWADYKTVTTPGAKPSTPTLTGSALSTSQVKLNWNAVSNATGYTVYQFSNGAWTSLGSLGASATTATVSNLTGNTSYSFFITANNAAGSTSSSSVTVKTLATGVKPSTPSVTGTALSSTEIKLSWNSVPSATIYTVYRSINGQWVSQGTLGASATSATISNLSANTSYSFYITAGNSYGASSSASIQVKTLVAGGSTAVRPQADVAYTVATGSLFGANGPKYTDVQQGNLGDCWLMASFAAIAARNPGYITSMFTAAGTAIEQGQTVNLYKVRFYDKFNQARYVTVDTTLPAGGNYYERVQGGVLWVALAEKAYAVANGLGYVTTQYVGQSSYAALNGGSPSWALQAVTGLSSSFYSVNPTNLASAWNAGKFIVLGSSPNANNNLIVGDSTGTHAYAMVGYVSSSSSPFVLFNPWNASSAVNGTITFSGKQVYGGTFNASATLISSSFNGQYLAGQSPFKLDEANEIGGGTIII